MRIFSEPLKPSLHLDSGLAKAPGTSDAPERGGAAGVARPSWSLSDGVAPSDSASPATESEERRFAGAEVFGQRPKTTGATPVLPKSMMAGAAAKSKARGIAWVVPFCASLLFVLVLSQVTPLGTAFEYYGNEGFNLMKALLVVEGHGLYQEVWSDQPPLFTFLLAGLFKVFGFSIVAARLLVLFFGALLVGAFVQIVRPQIGMLAAGAALTLLIFSPNFLQLSVSAMIMIPSLALALLAVVELPDQARREWLYLHPTEPSSAREVVRMLKARQADTHWVFTDNVMYPFYAGLPVPPEIAVLSHKRLDAGLITQAEILDVLRRYRPEQAVLMQSIFGEQILAYLKEHYTLKLEDGALRYYVLNPNSEIELPPKNAKNAERGGAK